MKRRSLIKFSLLSAALLVGIVLFLNYSREPSFQGKGINAWLDDYMAYTNTPYDKAIHQIGTNAIPYVLRRLAQNDSPWRIRYRAIWPRLPRYLKKIAPQPKPVFDDVHGANAFYYVGPDSIPQAIQALSNKSVSVRRAAAWGLSSLRRQSSAAEQAIPALTEVFRRGDDPQVQSHAAISIREMGPAASNAVPAMTAAMLKNGVGNTSSNQIVNASIAMALGKIGPAASNAVPVLKTILQNTTDVYIRCKMAVAIWRIDGDVETTLPVLIQEIPRENETTRWDEIIGLGEMGPLAKPALPMLEHEFTNKPTQENYQHLTNTLVKIDPEAAAKLGIK
jgi:HEAT repeat protein